jgi:Flp pilus assembly protein TadD
MATDRIQDLLELLADEPADALLRLMLGKEHVAAGDLAAALPHLEQAVALDPRYSAAYRELGAVLDQLGRASDAAAVWRRGIGVADETGDLQTAKEMRVFLKRAEGRR